MGYPRKLAIESRRQYDDLCAPQCPLSGLHLQFPRGYDFDGRTRRVMTDEASAGPCRVVSRIPEPPVQDGFNLFRRNRTITEQRRLRRREIDDGRLETDRARAPFEDQLDL